MPIYEFRCNHCQEKTSLFVKSVFEPISPKCASCGSRDLSRLVSGFAYHKAEQARQEEAGEPEMFPQPDYYKDPRNIGRWAEKRLTEIGLEVPDKVRQMIDAARDGDMSILDKKGLD